MYGHFYWFLVQSAGQQGSLVPFRWDANPETNEERRRDVQIYHSNLDVEQAGLGSLSSS